MKKIMKITIYFMTFMLLLSISFAGYGTVLDYQKISDTAGNFLGTLEDDDSFGNSVSGIGDLDNDGVEDIAVGAWNDDDGGSGRGAVWILFLNPNGTVKNYQKISDTEGGFSGTLNNRSSFGSSVSGIGDLDNDGVEDIAVGAEGDDDGGRGRGAVWILFLNPNGTVKNYQKISDTEGGFSGTLNNGSSFGYSVSGIGDLDNDGVEDIAVGAWGDDDGGEDRGAVWILFLNPNGTVKNYQKISDTEGNFGGTLDDWDYFGSSVSEIGDLDNDGVEDIAVGADLDDDGGYDLMSDKGAVWILFLNPNGTVKNYQKISDTEGNFNDTIDYSNKFGSSVSGIGDLDNDGVEDLAVGAEGDDDANIGAGAVWILFLNPNGTVKNYQKISGTKGGLNVTLDLGDSFGCSVSGIGDLDNDGVEEIAVGARGDDDGGFSRGAVWILSINSSIDTSTTPTYTNFISFPHTTNLSAVPDLTNVTNLTLETYYGILHFPHNHSVNVEGKDLDTHIKFGDCYVSVNISGLDYTFNATAYLLMNNSDNHCGNDRIYYAPGVYDNADAIRQHDTVCVNCEKLIADKHIVKFKVYHFSSYAIGSNANLTIYDNYEGSSAQPNANITFYANYTNKSGSHISGATCTIYFDGNSNEKHNMTDNGNNYNYTFSFGSTGTHNYNITCSATNYNTLSAVDDVKVRSVVPEFSSYLGLFIFVFILVLIVVFYRSNNKK